MCQRDLLMVFILSAWLRFILQISWLWNLDIFLQVYCSWEREGVCLLYLAGLDLFSRAAHMREISTKYLKYICDFPASEGLPETRFSLYIACLDVLTFLMFNTSRLCANSSTNKNVQSCTLLTVLMHVLFVSLLHAIAWLFFKPSKMRCTDMSKLYFLYS